MFSDCAWSIHLAAGGGFHQPHRLDLEGGRSAFTSCGTRSIGRSEPSKCFRVHDHHVVPQPQALQVAHQVVVDDVNSPDRLDLTDRLPKQGSIEASTPMMLEMVAVGRWPRSCCCACRRRRSCGAGRPSPGGGAIDVDVLLAALLGQQVQRVQRQHALVPQRTLVAGVLAALAGQLGRGPVGGSRPLPSTRRRTGPRPCWRRECAARTARPGSPSRPGRPGGGAGWSRAPS